MLRFFPLFFSFLLAASASDFVTIKAGSLGAYRVDAFEMADHPVTNAEYKLFVDAMHYPPPYHWQHGSIPAGMAQWPVIFVNHADALAYTKWLTKRDRRLYRLPTATEFEYAAYAGVSKAVYPWGKDRPDPSKANYDAKGDRTFAQWRRYLKPVKSYPPNPWGLYDMAGNAWQLVDHYPDPVLAGYTYRFDPLVEHGLAGGSWARTESYLRSRPSNSPSPGVRLPDIGFRVVRQPVGATHFERLIRRVIAAPAGEGAIYIGWQFLPQDSKETGFHVYRSTRRDAAGDRITEAPVRDSTNFVDRQPPAAARVYYRVRAVNARGEEGPPSEWAGVNPAEKRTGLVAVFEPSVKQGNVVPIFGDLDGDGAFDAVLRMDNGIHETARDPGVPVELEAITSYGKQLWRRPLIRHDHCYGNANNAPVAVYDLDGDGKAEVICRLQEGDAVYLAVLEGMSGRVLRKTPWPEMATDFAKSSTRIMLSIAYLDGKTPAIVTETGLYENEILSAYDRNLKKLWEYKSFGETNGSGSHRIDIADVDGDGRDEVFDGTTLLNPDGTMRWSIYREHADIVQVNHILPGSKDLQVFYAIETAIHAGAYLVDAKSGKVIWKLNHEDDPRWTHSHMGWAADIWEGSPGMEMLTNRDGHAKRDLVLFSADGKILMNPFPRDWRPINWTGGAVRDLMSGNGMKVGHFDGKQIVPFPTPGPLAAGGDKCEMGADLAGDFRDEVVCLGKDNTISVYTNLEPIQKRDLARTADRQYRLWLARNWGGGYASYFEWEP
jgi:rhamnogalacturonan endolyase